MAKKAASSGGAKKAAKPAAKSAAKPAAKKAAKKAGGTKKAGSAKKKSASAKLSDKQRELLSKVESAGEVGLVPDKADAAGARGLRLKKLLKGTKNKETGKVSYLLTNAGKKALSTAAPASA